VGSCKKQGYIKKVKIGRIICVFMVVLVSVGKCVNRVRGFKWLWSSGVNRGQAGVGTWEGKILKHGLCHFYWNHYLCFKFHRGSAGYPQLLLFIQDIDSSVIIGRRKWFHIIKMLLANHIMSNFGKCFFLNTWLNNWVPEAVIFWLYGSSLVIIICLMMDRKALKPICLFYLKKSFWNTFSILKQSNNH